jgi:hypothetical protein
MKLKKIINGNWYAPLKYLQNLKKVVDADLYEMANSAGNWSGYFVVKNKNSFSLFSFCQENKRFKFSLDYQLIAKFKKQPQEEEICDILSLYCY